MLQTHTLCAGATGSGKTVAAQVIVEEALSKDVSVVVFDPTAQWTGFFRPCKTKGMLNLYGLFNMKTDNAKSYNGNIYTIDDPEFHFDVKKYMNPGEITVFCMHKMDPTQIDLLVESTIKDVFMAHSEERTKCELLIVYDEVHRLLPKFGGSGKGFIQIERAAREFRKWGVGLILISQVLSDFVGEIKANIGTEIQMRTRYERDLERVKMKYGEDTMMSVVKASVGTGMVQNSEYNRGRPYFVSFRPLLHDPHRLSDEILDQYDKYNKRAEGLKEQLDNMKKVEVDVFDLELELTLLTDNIKRGSFDIVELYLESLEPRIKDQYEDLDDNKKGKIAEIRKKAEIERQRILKERRTTDTEAKKARRESETTTGEVARRIQESRERERIEAEMRRAAEVVKPPAPPPKPEEKVSEETKEAKEEAPQPVKPKAGVADILSDVDKKIQEVGKLKSSDKILDTLKERKKTRKTLWGKMISSIKGDEG